MSSSLSPLAQLVPALTRVLQDLEISELTPVQQAALPVLLAKQDAMIQAQTGSGKTFAFALPLLQALRVGEHYQAQALVLCPTRELAEQVAQQIRLLARYLDNVKVLTLCGGMPMGPQLQSLQHGAQVVVATPGRLLDHLERGSLDLGQVHILVFDEADRMLDMGFADSLAQLHAHVPRVKQSILLSATLPDNIRKLGKQWLKADAVEVQVSSEVPSTIEHRFVPCEPEQRLQRVAQILHQQQPQAAVLFCATKEDVRNLCHYLAQRNWPVIQLHGDMTQKERLYALAMFANGSKSIMVATDVAARGLDIGGLDLVINVQLCRPEVFKHRIGRTGRAGSAGRAFSLFAEKSKGLLADLLPEPQIELFLPDAPDRAWPSQWQTLEIDQGKKNKMRAGDVLGALMQAAGLPKDAIGKIQIFDFATLVAIDPAWMDSALRSLRKQGIKNRSVRVRVQD